MGITPNWGSTVDFNNNVNYTNNSAVQTSTGFVLAFSQNNGQYSKFVTRNSNGVYSNVQSLSSSGIQTFLSNGNDFEDIMAFVFNTSTTAPYLINGCSNVFTSGLKKLETEDTPSGLSYGRKGVLSKGDLEFVFNLGDVSVSGSTIKFIDKIDTIPIASLEELNSVVRTNDFYLTDQSEVVFSSLYYVVNKHMANQLLNDEFTLNFKTELVRTTDNIVVGTFDVVNYNKENVATFSNPGYSIECDGIDEGFYHLRLNTATNDEMHLFMGNVQREDFALEKKNLNKRNFRGEELVSSFNLSQNYPNPFNPVTTINYQIPKDGFVSLKVYDILGKEIATLVNSDKAQGKYTVEFDGSRFASGMYIYKLQSGDFVETRKMMMLK